MVKHIVTCSKFLISSLVAAVWLVGGSEIYAASSTVSKASVMVSTACSMTATVNTAHGTNIVLGQAKENIGLTTISTNCNDQAGFSIYAVGYTGNKIGATNSTALVGVDTGIAIHTGINDTASNWAMKVSNVASNLYPAIIDNNYDNYKAVPASFERVAHRDAATGSGTAGASQITTTYRAYIAPTQAADIYAGQVRYVLVHPETNVPKLDFDSAFASAGKTTYKNKAGVDTGYYTMQDMTSSICDSVIDYNTETQLIDTRDEKLYWVLKAQDGKCWMTQNLDLDLVEIKPNEVPALTSENTDLNTYDDDIYNSSLGYTYEESTGLITWAPSMATHHNNATHENGDKTGGSITNDNSNSNPRSWDLTVNGNEIYQKDGSTFNSTNCNYFTTPACLGADKNFNTEPFETNGEHGKIGNYYNWSAAVASNNTSSRTASTYNAIAESPKNSICPKGWRLTRSSSTPTYNDFQNLYSSYSSSISKTNGYPLWLVRAGYVYYGGMLGNSGSRGFYWSSTVYDSSCTYVMRIDSSEFILSYSNGYRGDGLSVRCVAR
ncbi:hypothetical protein IJI00_00770 [Candidatus Saccharibacteria bacterium]|nr:hypothetical protein [Candidatus Saccharibacteria bacterium]